LESYLTIKFPSEGSFKDRGSKFIAYAYPIGDVNEVKVHLEALRKKHYDARHHCYAFMIGADQAIYRANDDGEPGHSAGDPILGQIKSNNLTNILVVVVRYFGGTKLGISGLINAYRSAASEAISASTIVKRLITETITIQFPYEVTSQAMKLVDEFKIKIEDQKFTESCEISGQIQPIYKPEFQEKAKLIQGLIIKFE